MSYGFWNMCGDHPVMVGLCMLFICDTLNEWARACKARWSK